MLNFPLHDLWLACWQTVYMTLVSGFLSLLFGLVLGVLLLITRPEGILSNKLINQLLSFITNVGRSIPYIILMIAIIPLTRWLVGTSIGTNAAIVSLTLAAIPFFARVAESALTEVSPGVIEAAQAMGATRWQLLTKVFIPEAAGSLTKGATLTLINLIGYSAMAGAVGGGGLGELAINYGYQRFNPLVMLVTVILLVVLVQFIQILGDRLAKRPRLKLTAVMLALLFFFSLAAQAWPTQKQANVLRVGIISGIQQKIMQVAKQVAWQRYHLHLKVVPFDGYILPNTALNNGDIDANIFQHVPFLQSQIKARGYHLTPIAKTFVYPMGLYSRQIHSLPQLPVGSVVAIPEDPSNEGRALLLLQKAELIQLKSGVGIEATVNDITKNPKHLQIKTLNAAQLPRVLKDATLVALNNNYAKEAGFTVNQALAKESKHSPYANVIVVRSQDKNKPAFKQLIQVMHSQPVIEAVEQMYPQGGAIPAWGK